METGVMAEPRAPRVPEAPPAGGPVVYVSVSTGPHAGTTATWRAGSYLIGRGAHAQLPLPHDLAASVEHCRLEITEHGCTVQDLGSRQGTLVNGTRAGRSLVDSGDTIQVGLSSLAITVSTSAEEGATVLRRSRWSPAGETVLGDDAPSQSSRLLAIPGYTVGRKLGEGGMGVVYEATREATGERVAVKTIVPAPGSGNTAVLLFQREMELLAQLDHPRIVQYIESGQHAGQIYLVMEYVEAADLEPLVAKLERPRQIQVFCGVICQVLDALDYAHQRNLVHRDVKPRNILITRDGKRIAAKLADFGLAKNFELAGLSQMTEDHEIRGTPAFMPWEQLHNSRYVKPSADIYSAGATLYFFITGRSPGHTSPNARDLGELEELPQGLRDVLYRSLSSNPKERFPTAAEMRIALAPFAR
jgi:serine/threonine-protein kinase